MRNPDIGSGLVNMFISYSSGFRIQERLLVRAAVERAGNDFQGFEEFVLKMHQAN